MLRLLLVADRMKYVPKQVVASQRFLDKQAPVLSRRCLRFKEITSDVECDATIDWDTRLVTWQVKLIDRGPGPRGWEGTSRCATRTRQLVPRRCLTGASTRSRFTKAGVEPPIFLFFFPQPESFPNGLFSSGYGH